MIKSITLIALLFLAFSTYAQNSIVGKWKSFDDKTKEAKSIVEIFERSDKIYGRIIKTFPKPGASADPICSKCPSDDSRYNKKIIGMEIISDLALNEDEYSGGHILDPEVGKIYKCKLWIQNGELQVRGYLGPFFRTQTWQRIPN
jgi:uncharacterized protein (DUF2147 family)